MPGLDVSPNLVQDEGDDVWLHSQEQDVAVPHHLLVVPGQVHPQLLQEGTTQLIASPGTGPPTEQLDPCQAYTQPTAAWNSLHCPSGPAPTLLHKVVQCGTGQVSTSAEHEQASPWQPGNGCRTPPTNTLAPKAPTPLPGKKSPQLESDKENMKC